ncbi:hypothetical protein SA496_18275 [Pseudomonas sp. JS3066]|uniref:hypothetical protein n=1 Tax=unclassified Pseudomonas TaxID=196821 RepID=UPI00129EC895|nr:MULTISPECIES: hypothetical protein [unclassified Pseudomonas]WVK91661.1 hypothetical protein SA496_18275 [Pseudomonas sp. JS3066]
MACTCAQVQASGLGFAARAFLGARFRSVVELVAEVRLDPQSLHGKTPAGRGA